MDIMIVGEAWGEKEEETGIPFSGTAGYILNGMLAQSGINRDECYITNVFNLRPKPSNDIKNLCGPKGSGIPDMPELQKGKYVLSRYSCELERLYNEIRNVDPNIIICLGATASWALCHTTGIKTIRGYVTSTCDYVSAKLGKPYKVLPTYHPAAIGRDWTNRPVGLGDFDKARRESLYPGIRRPPHEIWIEPTLEDLERFEQEYILPASLLSADIETWKDQITCIGFSPDPSIALVIPFCSYSAPDGNYWASKKDELVAWNYVRRWLALKPTLFQNGLYDIQFLARSYGISVPLAAEDTMLLHHALQPEFEKGLGFLASLYTDEAAWKSMRKGKKHD